MSSDERTIMIIDPDEEVQEKIHDIMADKPCRFLFVDDLNEAAMQIAMEGPNLVIISLELPDIDGVELLDNIREFDDKVPILVMTGAPNKEKLVASKRAKAIDILLKPPDYDRIKMRVSAHLWLDPSLVKAKTESNVEETSFDDLRAEVMEQVAADRQEVQEEAVPKGAEVLNINDAIGGMKIARTLMWNDVVYGDKGELLTDKKLQQLSRLGVSEICVYIDEGLKKKVEQKKKLEAAKPAMGAQTAGGQKVFAKVKRAQVRVTTEEPTKIVRKLESGEIFEEDGIVADVSGGGCALLTKEQLHKGEEITLSFTLDEGAFPMDKVKGIVRHSMKRFGTDDFPYRSGIFFSSVTERFKENLITKLFKLERDNKKKEDELRARYGYAPKKHRPNR